MDHSRGLRLVQPAADLLTVKQPGRHLLGPGRVYRPIADPVQAQEPPRQGGGHHFYSVQIPSQGGPPEHLPNAQVRVHAVVDLGHQPRQFRDVSGLHHFLGQSLQELLLPLGPGDVAQIVRTVTDVLHRLVAVQPLFARLEVNYQGRACHRVAVEHPALHVDGHAAQDVHDVPEPFEVGQHVVVHRHAQQSGHHLAGQFRAAVDGGRVDPVPTVSRYLHPGVPRDGQDGDLLLCGVRAHKED